MKRVSCHLAFYDAENQVSGSVSYWHWFPQEIDPSDMDRFYSAFAKECRPASMADVRSGGVFGGIARIGGEWTVVFRYGDGGRNSAGRPGRSVIIAVMVRNSDIQGLDLTPLFRCREVIDLLEDASVKCPTPRPRLLDFEFGLIPIKADPVLLGQVVKEGGLVIQGPDSLDSAAGIFAHLPKHLMWLLKMGRDDMNGEQTEIRWVTSPTQPPPVPPSSQPSIPKGSGQRDDFLSRCVRHLTKAIHSIWVRPGLRMVVILLGIAAVISQILPQNIATNGVSSNRSGGSITVPVNTPGRLNHDVARPNNAPGAEKRPARESLAARRNSRVEEFHSALKWFVLGAIFGVGMLVVIFWKRKKRVAE